MKRKENLLMLTTSFTLMELLIVIMIVSMLTMFVLPNFSKSIERDHLRDAIAQLTMLHSSQRIYFSQIHDCDGNGTANEHCYWPPPSWAGGTGKTDINNNLSLNLLEDGITFSCPKTGNNNTFSCTATRTLAPPKNFVVTVTQASTGATNPGCTSNCPN